MFHELEVEADSSPKFPERRVRHGRAAAAEVARIQGTAGLSTGIFFDLAVVIDLVRVPRFDISPPELIKVINIQFLFGLLLPEGIIEQLGQLPYFLI